MGLLVGFDISSDESLVPVAREFVAWVQSCWFIKPLVQRSLLQLRNDDPQTGVNKDLPVV
jgi:hypothetical protein